jgi:hypothetical protein
MKVRFIIIALIAVSGLQLPNRADEPTRISFNRDVRPILSDTCFHCHGFDQKSRMAGLRLDLREEAIQETENGITPIVPGDPTASAIIERVFSSNADDVMPPIEAHKELTAAQKETLRRWVAQGAVYEPHWAYVPLAKPVVPQNGNLNPVDAFIREKLASQSITPSLDAPRAKLLRRLSLDLIGLPPTPEEVTAFTADMGKDAYERQVDRLLNSPHFGERMAVWWLDIARFADTVGYHGDQNQRIFPYRDYVIDSFNTNKPFDQFTIEQLAGDLLPNPTTEQLVATGYNRLTMMTREGGAQPKEYLAKYGAERVRAVGAAWFGSTFGCAECHDHKFDPIKTRDFYELQSFFADVKQWGSYYYGYTTDPELLGLSVNHPFPPEIEVDSPYLMTRKNQAERELTSHLAASRGKLAKEAGMSKAFEQWIAESRDFLQREPTGWAQPQVSAAIYKDGKPLQGGEVAIGKGGAVELGRTIARAEQLRVALRPKAGRVAALRVEIVSDGRSPDKRTAARKQEGMRLAAHVRAVDGKERKLAVYFAEADAKELRFVNGVEVNGVGEGWKLPPEETDRLPSSVWLLDPPVMLCADETLEVTLSGDPVLPVRISVSPFAAYDPLRVAEPRWREALFAEKRTEQEQSLLADSWLISTAEEEAAFQRFKQLSVTVRAYHRGRAWTMVTKATTPLTVRVLPRGNWQDESGPVVLPATPSFLPGRMENSEEKRLTRLDLAKYIVSKENPLTARAVMNRLWAQFFGAGLSATLDDLGSQGELPSHPELLDFIAAEFRERGWDLKHMIRLIVTSATYRQSSNLRSELLDIDPANRLLGSQNPRRIEAEFVRDNALFIAGLLNVRDVGGPSVQPYQPEGYYESLTVPERVYVNSRGPEQWRRGLYMHWQRTFLHPMLANFDAPARDECAAQRNVSNTPQQALTLLNDPTFVEAARLFAARLLATKQDASEDERIENAFQLAVARSPKPKEAQSLKEFLGSQREQFAADPSAAAKLLKIGQTPPSSGNALELAAWTSLCRVLLNLQEVITRY